jgi:DNA-binding CsgD family transcriptional regulator
VLHEEIVHLYEQEPDLLELPQVLFTSVARLLDADVVAYTEFHQASGEFRSVMSVEDAPEKRARAIDAFARHMHSHPLWVHDPAFFKERALRESDFFDDEEFLALPIVKEVFLPSRARYLITIVMAHENYVLSISGYRVIGRSRFSDEDRDRLEAFRPHILRTYRQAQQRTLAKLTPEQRLGLAFPDLTPRQLEVASWLAQGKSNEDIAAILAVGIDTVKAHVKALYSKIGSNSRLGTAIIAHTAPPFVSLPPLWKLPLSAWGPRSTS